MNTQNREYESIGPVVTVGEMAGHPPAGGNGKNGGGNYGSRLSMKDVMPVLKEEPKIPSINKTYIQSIAKTKGPEGEADVRNYHDLLFSENNAELQAKCVQLQNQAVVDGEGISRNISELSHINAFTDRYQEKISESVPWTTFSKIQVCILAVFSVVLLAVGVNTTAQVMLASGIRGFENPLRCYLFSSMSIGLAVGFKYLRTPISQQRRRIIYIVIIWLCGLGLGILWVFMFVSTFPAITQTAADIVNSLSIENNPTDGSHGYLIMAVSMLAESFLAAGAWLTIESIVEKHQPSTRIVNPAYEKTQQDLDFWMGRKYEQEECLAKIQGKVKAIEEAKHRFVEEAVGFFRLAHASAAQNKEMDNLFNS